VARQCAVEQVDYQHYLLLITELELLDRERRATERRNRQTKFPVVKTLDTFDFLAISSANKTLVLDLARCQFLSRKEICFCWVTAILQHSAPPRYMIENARFCVSRVWADGGRLRP